MAGGELGEGETERRDRKKTVKMTERRMSQMKQ